MKRLLLFAGVPAAGALMALFCLPQHEKKQAQKIKPENDSTRHPQVIPVTNDRQDHLIDTNAQFQIIPPVSPPPPAPKFHHRKNLFVIADKTLQIFVVNNTRDTTLVCQEGTRLTIWAASFVNERTGQPVNQVNVRVKEYYTDADIILAGLTTSSGKEMLETGGMIHVDVVTGTDACKLKNGQSVEVTFPYTDLKEGMQVFNGQLTAGTMNWIPVRKEEYKQAIPDNYVYDVVEVSQQAEPTGGMESLKQYLANNVRYPQDALDACIQGKVYVGFIIDEKGEVSNVTIKRGVSTGLDAEARRVVTAMPRWKPAWQNGKKVKQLYVLPINFRIGDGCEYTKAKTYYQEQVEKKDLADVKVQNLQGYVLSSSNLGWINCDRFVNQPKIDFVLEEKNDTSIVASLVFQRIRGIMPPMVNDKQIRFSGVPANEGATLVAFKRMGNKNYMALQEINTSNRKTKLAFKEVSMDELKNEIHLLNHNEKTGLSMNQ